MELTYYRKGDYLFPNLAVKDEPQTIGKYGMLRRTYLKENRRNWYQSMLMSGRLNQHLAQIEEAAESRVETLLDSLNEVSGTEQGERPAGMGGAPEQPDGDGRRDRLEGIGVQLTETTTEQDLSEAEEEIASAFSFPDLPTVEQQIHAIEEPIRAQYAEKIALDSEVVDEVLRTGSNRSKGQLRLIYNFMVENPGRIHRVREKRIWYGRQRL